MKIVTHIGTYNEPVDKALRAADAQTYPVTDVIVVDNASTEPVLPERLASHVTVVSVDRNIGPNSAVAAGMQYALDHGYDWFWLLESDGPPRPDALEKLVRLYESLDDETRRQVGCLCCSQVLLPSDAVMHGRLVTPGGPRHPVVDERLPYCDIDYACWTGVLFRMDVVREVGLPRLGTEGYWEDLSQDFGDMEYTYRIRAAGYRLLAHRTSLVDLEVGYGSHRKFMGVNLLSTNHSPQRRYMHFRNMMYFWVHIYGKVRWPQFIAWLSYRFAVTAIGIIVLEDNRWAKIVATLRGIRDGWQQKLLHKYGA